MDHIRTNLLSISLATVGLLNLISCCPDIEVAPDSNYQALVRYPTSNFIDSAGATIQLVVSNEYDERVESQLEECGSAVQYELHPVVELSITGSSTGTITYDNYEKRLAIGGTFGPQVHSSLPRVDTIIQGHLYEDCLMLDQSSNPIIFNQDYGIIQFRYGPEHLYQRVEQ